MTGAPVVPGRNVNGPSLLPSGGTVPKNACATSCCPDPIGCNAKLPAALITSYGCVPSLTPTATRGGLNDVWVTQFTVADATSSPLRAVNRNSPYGMRRSAVFLAC